MLLLYIVLNDLLMSGLSMLFHRYIYDENEFDDYDEDDEYDEQEYDF